MLNQRHVLYTCALLMDMSVAGATFAITRRAAELGATAAQLGLLSAVWIGSYAALALMTGRVSDRIGRRRMALVGCIIAASMSLACAFTTRVSALLGLCVLFGGGVAFFWPSIIAWLGEGVSGPALARRLTNFSVAWNIGLLLGFGYTGVLFKHGPRLSFYVAAAAIVVIAVLLLFVEAAAPAATTEAARTAAATVPKGRGFRKTAWLANFSTNFAFTGAIALFPQLATKLEIGADVHGWLMALGRGIALASFVVLELLMFWRTRLWPLWVAQAVGAAGILVMALGNSTAMFAVSLIVMGAVSGYAYQASIYFTLEEISEKGKGSGFHEAIVGSGMCFGPLLAGLVGNHHSLRAPYYFCAWALVFGIALQIAMVAVRRRIA
jgi:MFS family permease